MNTQIFYMYRDADNYKKRHSVIIKGKLSPASIDRLKGILEDGLYFIPSDLGLEDLQKYLQDIDVEDNIDEDGYYNPYGPEGADHVWHELGPIEYTTSEPTVSITCEDLDDVISADNFVGWTVEGTEEDLAAEALERKRNKRK